MQLNRESESFSKSHPGDGHIGYSLVSHQEYMRQKQLSASPPPDVYNSVEFTNPVSFKQTYQLLKDKELNKMLPEPAV